jgi:hypothetical protein
VASRCGRARLWRRLTLRGASIGRDGGLEDVVAVLPPANRAALFCHVSLDLPPDEVARVLGTSTVRVRNRIYRAGERVEAEIRRREEAVAQLEAWLPLPEPPDDEEMPDEKKKDGEAES